MLDAIINLVGAVLATFCVGVLAYPLMKSRARGQLETPETEGENGFPELDSIYESIRTLQLEYGLGKVGGNLYRQQLSDYRLQAAGALRRREEQQELAARANLAGAHDNLADDNSARGSGRCPSCGVALNRKTAECPKCAAKIGLGGPDLP